MMGLVVECDGETKKDHGLSHSNGNQ
jgi:hypothetical protein